MFSRIWKFIKKILPFLIILAIIFAPQLGALFGELGWTTLGGMFTALGSMLAPLGFWGALAAGVGAAFLLVPDETAEMLTSAVDAIGDVATAVVDTVGDVTSHALSSVLSSPILWIGVALVVGYVMVSDSTKGKETTNGSI